MSARSLNCGISFSTRRFEGQAQYQFGSEMMSTVIGTFLPSAMMMKQERCEGDNAGRAENSYGRRTRLFFILVAESRHTRAGRGMLARRDPSGDRHLLFPEIMLLLCVAPRGGASALPCLLPKGISCSDKRSPQTSHLSLIVSLLKKTFKDWFINAHGKSAWAFQQMKNKREVKMKVI